MKINPMPLVVAIGLAAACSAALATEYGSVISSAAVTGYKSRIVGYDVTYAYQGQRYATRVAQDPGERIALNVSIAPAVATVAVAPAAPPAIAAPPVVYSSVPAYGAYGLSRPFAGG